MSIAFIMNMTLLSPYVTLDNVTELAELKPNADNLVNLDCDGDEKSSLRLPIITT
jgi:hypothetical protein